MEVEGIAPVALRVEGALGCSFGSVANSCSAATQAPSVSNLVNTKWHTPEGLGDFGGVKLEKGNSEENQTKLGTVE